MKHQKDNKSNANHPLDKELQVVIDFAYKAGNIVKNIRSRGYKIFDKGKHLGLVTEADQEVSQFLVKSMKQVFPDDLIISEEEPLPPKSAQADRIWFIDPIDGTSDFISGSNEWSVMLGLAIKGEAQLGVVYQPDTQELYYAIKDCGSFFTKPQKNQPLQVNTVSDPARAILIQSRSHWSTRAENIAKELGINKIIKHGSLGLKLGKIAKGEADLYFNFSGHCHLWDLCAPEIILNEAGGKLLTASTNRLIYCAGETRIKEGFLATTNSLATKVQRFLQ
ncbi:inositol monophosphatase [Legionella lansingensis]|uniref:Inositol monophosphatase n=1 Tax=Legionella lansingensis TaxID=45067 RepID=A0A0W0VTH6_9GAMM|nr:3'(2'),5'-bisphosphate nucleotidase CysQ [Legionella lansingensis]KTD23375.1 inositol monophosphatase [Legionella lansingensis]SNV49444.1 inositol monophosphatase [Legionella lansingensis]